MKIVFDVETNGLYFADSVLSISAVKFGYDPSNGSYKEIEVLNRYYFPREELSAEAVEINGLTLEEIARQREGCHYPEHFDDDPYIDQFFEDPQVDRWIAHNYDFDIRHMRKRGLDAPEGFCTMLYAKDAVPAA